MLDNVVKIPLCVVRALLFSVVFKMSGYGNNKPTLGGVERDHELKIILKGRDGSYKDSNVTYFKSYQSTFGHYCITMSQLSTDVANFSDMNPHRTLHLLPQKLFPLDLTLCHYIKECD